MPQPATKYMVIITPYNRPKIRAFGTNIANNQIESKTEEDF